MSQIGESSEKDESHHHFASKEQERKKNLLLTMCAQWTGKKSSHTTISISLTLSLSIWTTMKCTVTTKYTHNFFLGCWSMKMVNLQHVCVYARINGWHKSHTYKVENRCLPFAFPWNACWPSSCSNSHSFAIRYWVVVWTCAISAGVKSFVCAYDM